MLLRRSFVDWLISILEASAFLTVLFSIATAFDELHRFLELFSHFRLQYFAASVLLFGSLLALRRHRAAAVMLLTAAFNALYIAPWYAGSAQAATPSSLALLHANILASNHETTKLLEHIDREQPDLVFLQELTDEHVHSLESLGEMYPHQLRETRGDPFGIGVWSKLPLESAEVIATPPRDLPSLRFRIAFDGVPVTLVSTHPVPPLGREFYEHRNSQLAAIAEVVRGIDGAVIVTGDLNITPWAANYRRFEQLTGLENVQKGHGIQPSWPLFLPVAMIPIDHVLLSSGLYATEVRALGSIGSDHRPLLVRIAHR